MGSVSPFVLLERKTGVALPPVISRTQTLNNTRQFDSTSNAQMELWRAPARPGARPNQTTRRKRGTSRLCRRVASRGRESRSRVEVDLGSTRNEKAPEGASNVVESDHDDRE